MTDAVWPSLDGCESESLDEEGYWRQVHPSWVHDGQPSSQVFTPTKKDEGKLSVAQASVVTADEAFRRYIARGHSSVGMLVVESSSISELEVRAVHDSACEGVDEEHAYVDYRCLSRGGAKKVASELLIRAVEAEWAYLPDPGAE